jgi:hypothetical protein
MKLRTGRFGSVIVGLVVATSTFGQTPPADPNPAPRPQQEMKPGVGWSDAAQSNKPEKTNASPSKSPPKKKEARASSDAGVVPPSTK